MCLVHSRHQDEARPRLGRLPCRRNASWAGDDRLSPLLPDSESRRRLDTLGNSPREEALPHLRTEPARRHHAPKQGWHRSAVVQQVIG